ncbi:hypothetical protein ACO34A_01405 [Rhizobium sp. ACO-34A]|nr:hypothetical protein [Rhizobium sp. ACO-34A]ATN32467.1 hypothetical protein ACO34A_01405 [Rhizobium sp. ACO-34A]
MNKIVRNHYPVENLPADLREGLGEGKTVRVVVEIEGEQLDALPVSMRGERKKPLTVGETLKMIEKYRLRRPVDVDMKEAVQRVRELRDEWDDE